MLPTNGPVEQLRLAVDAVELGRRMALAVRNGPHGMSSDNGDRMSRELAQEEHT